jgi:hypothetical protein
VRPRAPRTLRRSRKLFRSRAHTHTPVIGALKKKKLEMASRRRHSVSPVRRDRDTDECDRSRRLGPHLDEGRASSQKRSVSHRVIRLLISRARVHTHTHARAPLGGHSQTISSLAFDFCRARARALAWPWWRIQADWRRTRCLGVASPTRQSRSAKRADGTRRSGAPRPFARPERRGCAIQFAT